MTVHTQFSPRQRAALASICDTFFPADNGVPSARELGVVDALLGAGAANPRAAERRQLARLLTLRGTVTLIEKCSGAVGFEAVATEHRWVVHISGGSVGRGDLTPDRQAVGHLGSPFGRAEQMPSRPEVCGDAAEGGQEPLRMPRRFEAFHRPFALSGGLMRVLGAVVQIPRPPVLHRRHELAVGDLVAAQLVGDQHARHVPQALEQLTEESLGRHRVSA